MSRTQLYTAVSSALRLLICRYSVFFESSLEMVNLPFTDPACCAVRPSAGFFIQPTRSGPFLGAWRTRFIQWVLKVNPEAAQESHRDPPGHTMSPPDSTSCASHCTSVNTETQHSLMITQERKQAQPQADILEVPNPENGLDE